MLREIHRTVAALSGTAGSAASTANASLLSTLRAVMQIALTVILVPLCLWVLFGSTGQGGAARDAAAALLGAVVTFWLKD